MKRQIDHFLLGLLWLLAVLLGGSFWLNTRFGFNIFSIQHWEYLGQLQASRITVNSWFYISMVMIVVIMLGGLYLIVRPRFRRIKFASAPVAPTQPKQTQIPADTLPQEVPVAQPDESIRTSYARPPRLNIPLGNARTAVHPTAAIAPPQIPATPSVDYKEIENIFTKNGYLVKNPPKIGGIRPALFAIGSDETLWIGAVDIEPGVMASAVEKLRDIFIETLEDIEINIQCFIINAKPDSYDGTQKIEIFNSVPQLQEFMANNKNRKLSESEAEDFDAYSDYIDTVADYFNKL